MATTILITCPECKKQVKGPATLVGKKVRCKACDHTFMVTAAPTQKAVPQAKSTKTKAPATAEDLDSDEREKNPYQITDVSLTYRCPQCAAEMPSQDAIICLNCGYNTQTRQRMRTIKTYAHTPLDWILWLAPGVLCVIAVVLVAGFIVFLWVPVGLPTVHAKNKDAWWSCENDLFNYQQIWGSFIAALGGWVALKFAFKRLVLHPRPPEKYKRGSEQ
jgi:DNA-directed RNA polymerase subunit RPC12/RpoP